MVRCTSSRLILAAAAAALVLLLLANNARSLQSVLSVTSQHQQGSGLLAAVEFDPLAGGSNAASPPPATAAAGRARLTPTLPSASPPPPPPAAAPPGKPCPSGCEARGSCNRELGKCECPPLLTGPACELNAVPSCRNMWGLNIPVPPCQAFSAEDFAYRDFPATCECLAECHALNLRIVYVENCVNASQKFLQPMGNAPSRLPTAQHMWRDRFGDGRWLRQAYKPGRNDAQLTDAELGTRNLALAARLHRDANETTRMGLCSGNGLWTQVMPWFRQARSLCHCFPGWFGENCEIGPGDTRAPSVKQYCVHTCEGRGVCKLNYCHCVPGTWGVDCGFGEPDAPLARSTADEQRRLRLSPPFGWSDEMMTTPKPVLPPAALGLRIYVYNLPPECHIWLAAHFRRAGRWDQSYLYSLDAKMHRWLLRSPYRTLDPNEADYFYIPAYLSLGFYDFEFGLYWLSNRGHAFLNMVLDHVEAAGPWFKRKGGADHLLVMTNDKGATFIRGSVRRLERVNLITQWGWVRGHIHRRGVDVVVPPMLKVDKLIGESPFMGSAQSTKQWLAQSSAGYEYLLSFVGSVRFHTPGYSMGVRQKIFRKYNQSSTFFLRDLRGDSIKGVHKALPPREYLRVLRASKFCLAPSGMGFSTRTYESVAQGCVPLIIQDEPVSNTTVDQSFAELLPWEQFSLRLTQADIPNLPTLLANFPDAEWRRLRRNLACAWPRVLWLQADNEAPGSQTAAESAKADATAKLGGQAYLAGFDAFESVMHTLARRSAASKGSAMPPFEWRSPAESCRAASDGQMQPATPPVSGVFSAPGHGAKRS